MLVLQMSFASVQTMLSGINKHPIIRHELHQTADGTATKQSVTAVNKNMPVITT